MIKKFQCLLFFFSSLIANDFCLEDNMSPNKTYNFSAPYSTGKLAGRSYPYNQQSNECGEMHNGVQSKQNCSYPQDNTWASYEEGNPEPMVTMPPGEEHMDPSKEYQDPRSENLYFRYEPEYTSECKSEYETRYSHKRHCRYVPQYYQKRCCVYVPQYYYVTRVAYVPEYYYSAKRYEVPNHYAVPKIRYKKRFYKKNECQECQYLDPDESECVYGRP